MTETRMQSYKDRIVGVSDKKRNRDFQILELLTFTPELTQTEVLEILHINISQPAISKIVRENIKLYLEMVYTENPLATKEGRVLEKIKHYRRKKSLSKKDPIDILDSIRSEEDKGGISVDRMNILITNFVQEREKNADTGSGSRLSIGDSQVAIGDSVGV